MSEQSQLLRMLEPAVRPGGSPAPSVKPKPSVDGASFDDLLGQVRQGGAATGAERPLKLSAHAQQRLEQRGVSLDAGQMQAMAQAAEKAEAKGAKDTLMLMDGMGMIVNVPNRTVLTVLDEGRMRDGVVTQIDSAVSVNAPTEPTEAQPHRLQL